VSIVSPYRYWLKLIEVIAATIILSDFEWDLLSGKWGLSLHTFRVETATQDSDILGRYPAKASNCDRILEVPY